MLDRNVKEDFVKLFGFVQSETHRIAIIKKWWKNRPGFHENPIIQAGVLSLVTEELGEALRELRQPELRKSKELPGRLALTVEIADIITRAMDFAEKLRLPLGAVIIEKMEYNEGREDSHGGKIF